MVNSQENSKIRVCVIGAGAAGLCAARHLSNDLINFEPEVFERSGDIGGTWIYTDKVGTDDDGFPIHSSMYKSLRTNIPVRLMNFPDYQGMNQSQPSCGTHKQVLNYLNNYAKHFDLHRFIQFRTLVENVRPIENGGDWRQTTFKVRVRNLESGITEEKDFDAVMVCNGRYSVPKKPQIPGIESFPGHSMHSHDYREPDSYAGKTVILFGAGPSGEDIAIEISKVAEKVYLSHHEPRITGPLPSNLIQVADIESVDKNEFKLKDGTSVTADALLFCTGYSVTFPFLDETCGITVNNDVVSPLYQSLINVHHPKLCILGILFRIVPFVMSHAQAQYFLRLLKGQVELPSQEAMLEISQSETEQENPHLYRKRQWEYYNELADAAGFERAPEYYGAGHTLWLVERKKNLSKSKDSEIIIEEDGKTVHINVEL